MPSPLDKGALYLPITDTTFISWLVVVLLTEVTRYGAMNNTTTVQTTLWLLALAIGAE